MSHENGSHKRENGPHEGRENWGLCKDCQWWQIEPEAKISDRTVGVCIENSLHDFRLRIAGNGGCTMFVAGEPARATGSADTPPTTFAMR